MARRLPEAVRPVNATRRDTVRVVLWALAGVVAFVALVVLGAIGFIRTGG